MSQQKLVKNPSDQRMKVSAQKDSPLENSKSENQKWKHDKYEEIIAEGQKTENSNNKNAKNLSGSDTFQKNSDRRQHKDRVRIYQEMYKIKFFSA